RVEQAGESADPAEHLGTGRALHRCAHQLDGAFAGFDGYATVGVGRLLGFTHDDTASLETSSRFLPRCAASGSSTGYTPSKQARHNRCAGTPVAPTSSSREM